VGTSVNTEAALFYSTFEMKPNAAMKL